MNSTLEEAKIEIKSLLESLFKTVTDALSQSMQAFEDLDGALANRITANFQDVENSHHRVEDLCFNSIAIFQPRDAELRRFIAYVTSSNGLHNVGRFATKIGEIVTLCEGLDHFKDLETLPYLAELASTALNISIRAVLDENLTVCGYVSRDS
jgi:phosphate uptake regulator